MAFFGTIAFIFLLLVANEFWWLRTRFHGEIGRKLIHVVVGSFVAFWPFFLSWAEILILSGAFLVVVSISKWLNVFQAIHSVQRPTYGELFFAVAVGAVALISREPYVFAAALLQMALADGMAAIVGTRYGGANRYRVMGYTKSVIGSLAFFVVSVLILFWYVGATGSGLEPVTIYAIALVATLLENFGGPGYDNLSVPVFVATALVLL